MIRQKIPYQKVKEGGKALSSRTFRLNNGIVSFISASGILTGTCPNAFTACKPQHNFNATQDALLLPILNVELKLFANV